MSAGAKDARRALRNTSFGLLLGALAACALAWLVPRAAASMGNALAPARADAPPPRAASPPRPTTITSSIPRIPPAFDDDAAMKTRADGVVDYTLRASLDPEAHIVRGEGTILWRNVSRAPVRELYVHLYLNAFKTDHSLFARTHLHSGRGIGKVVDAGYIDVHELVAKELNGIDLWATAERHSPGDPNDETDIRVPLPEAIAPGESLTLEVAFTAKLPNVVARTGYFGDFHMVGQWFPKVAKLEADGTFAHFPFHRLSEFYADYGFYDVTIEAPDDYVIGATGRRTEEVRDNGKARVRYVQDSVHDFAFTAWNGFRERSVEADGVTIRALFPKGFEALAERQLETAVFGLRRYGQAFGRYPYSTLTIIHPPPGADEAGGMEYPTLITTGGSSLQPRALGTVEHLTLHELGHQFFYGLIANDEHALPFLDEGLNSYAESVFLPELRGEGSFFDAFGLKLGVGEGHRVFAIERGHNAPVAQPAPAFRSGADYAALVYSRTATVMQTFARVYGQDAVMRALGRYARRYRFEHPGLEEFLAAMRDVLGDPAERNLRSALLDRAWVDYAVEEASSEKSGSTWEGSALVTRRGALAFPVDVDLVSEDGTRERVRWDGQADSLRLPYRGTSPLAAVVVDPDTTVWLDEDLSNNARRVRGRAHAPRTLERVTYWAELLLHGVMP